MTAAGSATTRTRRRSPGSGTRRAYPAFSSRLRTPVTAPVVTWLLHLAGWGKPSGPRPPDQWDWRVRDTTARTGHPDCLGCRLAGRRAPTARTPGPVTAEPAPAPPRAPAATVRA
ncbi:HGxxPAAW family protein [Streptomyces sp. NPDC012421]|uniref:HGxxPAAW family protein n=1 Tax=Streptomyces sp. NPDC012421 TaxID=3364832 RepID=UPI0036E7ABE2